MEGLSEEAQWIILMGLIVAIALFFLAVVINESSLVGQTTAESVLDFSKADIRDIRTQILDWYALSILDAPPDAGELEGIKKDIIELSIYKKNAVVDFSTLSNDGDVYLLMHYDNGVTNYNENAYVRKKNE